MEHVVFFPAPDGSPAFRRLGTAEEAVRFVEHLRNAEGISAVSLHTLTEVPLAFRTWYSVEVPAAVTPVPAVPVAQQVPVSAALVEEPPVPAPAGQAQPEPAPTDAPGDGRVALSIVPQPGDPAEPAAGPQGTERPVGSAPAAMSSLGFFA